MGWASGSGLMSEVISAIKEAGVDFEKRVEIYTDLIGIFESHDCDTMDECMGEDKAFDKAMRESYPEYFEEEDVDLDEWADEED